MVGKKSLLVCCLIVAAQATHAFKLPDINKTVQDATDKVTGNSKEEPVNSTASYELASPVDELAKEDVSKAKNVGEVLGVILGVVAAKEECADKSGFKKDLCVAAFVKGFQVAGSEIGKQVGIVAAQRRKVYATEHEYLESEIKASESAISTREKGIQENKAEINKVSSRVKELQAKQNLTAAEIKEAKKIRDEQARKLEENKKLEATYNDNIAYLDYALETSEEQAKEKNQESQVWKDKYQELKTKRDQLVIQRDEIANQNAQLTNDQKALDELIS